jgi:hypothetical protein
MLRKLADEIDGSSFIGFISIILMLLVLSGKVLYCLVQVLKGRGHETFHMIVMEHPVFTFINASFMDVLIFEAGMLIALVVGLVWRYFYYRDEREFLKKYKIKGKTGFWGPIRSNDSERDYNDYGD